MADMSIGSIIDPSVEPVRGLFTSTFAESPNLRTILPAMIREKDAIDVIFVYRNHITVQEQVGFDESDDDLESGEDGPAKDTGRGPELEPNKTGRLHLMLSKNDFDSIITCARILTLDAPSFFHQEFRPRAPYDLFSRAREATTPRTSSTSPGAQSDGKSSSGISHEYPACEIPPQILVLTLRRGKTDSIALLFLTGNRPEWHWLCHQSVLPISPLFLEEERRESLALTAHLTVDHRGRAIAVGAHEERVVLYRLKRSRTDWFLDRTKSTNGFGDAAEPDDDFNPFDEHRELKVNGTILKMEFLQREKEPHDDTLVVLLLVVRFNDRETQFQRWDWDTNKTLGDGLNQVWMGMTVETRLSKPDLLIPSTIKFGFSLVTERLLARYTLDKVDVTGTPQLVVASLPHPQSNGRLENRFLPKSSVTWTAWARPIRDPQRFIFDHIYMARRDGQLCYLEISPDNEVPPIRTDMNLGKGHDTALAVMFNSYGGHELIVTSAGFFVIAANREPRMLQRYSDWSPVGDLGLTPNASEMVLTSLASPERLNFIHTAFEAVTWHTTAQQFQSRARWILPGNDAHQCLLMSSSDSETQLQHVTFSQDEDNLMTEGDEVGESFDTETRTLAAGRSGKGAFIQVTSSEIRATLGKSKDALFKFEGPATAACLDDEFGNVLLFIPGPSRPALHLVTVDVENEVLVFNPGHDAESHGLKLDDQIDSIACMSLSVAEDGFGLAALSAWGQDLLLIRISPHKTISVARGISCDITCESIVIEKLPQSFVVVLGLRDGDVRYADVDHVTGDAIDGTAHHIGKGPVTLLAIPGGVLALCEGKLCKLERGVQKGRIFQQQVSLSETKHVAIEAMSLMHESSHNEPWIVFFSPSRTIFTTLRKAKTFCRSRPMFPEGDDCKFHQITHVRRYDDWLAVAYEYTCLDRSGASPSSSGMSNRQQFARLGFVRPRSQKQLTNENTNTIGKSGTEIQDMFEWNAELGGSKWKLLVVRARVPSKTVRDGASGRLMIYTVGETGMLTPRSKFKRETPIDAAAVYSHDKIIISSSKEGLELVALAKSDSSNRQVRLIQSSFKRDINMKSKALRVSRSPGNHKLVYVTDPHRVTLFNEQFDRRWESEACKEMNQTHLITSGATPMVLALSQDGILGLWHDHTSQTNSTNPIWRDSLKTLFRANLQNQIVHMTPHGTNWYVGTTALGQLCQISVLSEDEWRLLRYVQNMAEQDRRVCPFSWKDGLDVKKKHAKKPLDPSNFLGQKAKKAPMHINGDILRRVSGNILRDDLIPNAKAPHWEVDLNTPAGRTALLEKLAQKVLPDLGREELHTGVVEWIRTFWQPRV